MLKTHSWRWGNAHNCYSPRHRRDEHYIAGLGRYGSRRRRYATNYACPLAVDRCGCEHIKLNRAVVKLDTTVTAVAETDEHS